jgi:hypothetical protein
LEKAMNRRLENTTKLTSALVALTVSAFGGETLAAATPPTFVQDGKAGFVVAHIEYALSKDAKDTGVCPDGMTQGMRREGVGVSDGAYQPGSAGSEQRSAASAAAGPAAASTASAAPTSTAQGEKDGPAAQQKPATTPEEAERQFVRAITDPNRTNACANPESVGPDPNFRVVKTPDAKAYGIDLDGQDSRAKGKLAPGTCAHNDLLGMNGERGIDNQFFRVVGCSNSYQSTGQSNGYAIEMLTGSWGILLSLSGVDDIRNDDDVEVGIFSNADPIELSPTREPLPNATYAIDQDPRFQGKTRGRIKDGVLTTDPVDVRFHKITNSIYLERPLVAARVKMTLSEDGVLEGYLAGYTPVAAMYNLQYAFSDGKNGKGEPAAARLITVSSMGQAAVLGHTCNGAYYALKELADGHPDPATGKCTSISTQYRIKAIPAFVVDEKTQSVNKDLER